MAELRGGGGLRSGCVWRKARNAEQVTGKYADNDDIRQSPEDTGARMLMDTKAAEA